MAAYLRAESYKFDLAACTALSPYTWLAQKKPTSFSPILPEPRLSRYTPNGVWPANSDG